MKRYVVNSSFITINAVKILKIWTQEKIAVIILKFEQNCFTTEKWVQKSNSVDPDQCGSSLIRVYTVCPDLTVRNLTICL